MRDIKEIEARYEYRKNTRGKVNLLKKRYILIFILLLALITNPGKEKHKHKIMQRVEAAMGANVFPADIKDMQNDPFLDRIVDSYIDYSNYFFFSTTSAKIRGSSKTVGVGVFGYVYIPDKLEEVIKNNQF